MKSHNIKTGRSKDDLVASLVANFSEKDIKKTFNQKFYIMTEKSNKLNGTIWPNLFGSGKQTPKERESGESLANDYAKQRMALLKKELIANLKDKDFGLYRNTFYDISELHQTMQEYKKQMYCLCIVCFIDLNGMEWRMTIL